MVDVLDAFDLKQDVPAHVCFVGGGGKTTTMFYLAHELKSRGLSVLVTTTTNIFYPDVGLCDEVIMDPTPFLSLFKGVRPGTVTCLGSGVFGEMKKVKSISPDFLDRLFSEKIFDCILVEADGAKRKSIKASADYEPVIPKATTNVIGVVGMDVLGQPAKDDFVHRIEKFCEVTSLSSGDIITEKAVSNLIKHPNGMFKGAPIKAFKTVLLNKADTEKRREQGKTIAGLIKADSGISAVLTGSMEQAGIYNRFDVF